MLHKQTYYNPVVSGYYPDPSVVRAGEDFYMVNSSFEFFPGVPLSHSKNLVNWELIGHCLSRRSQLPLDNAAVSTGILAPTIRYHKGVFYMITTNLTSLIKKGVGNFIVTATDPEGQWSEPVWIRHEGIDPSLFFDDDDKAYYCGTGFDSNGQAIVLFEIDVRTGNILSEKKSISYGCCGKCPEAPHIYKKDGMYYLLLAEGGTEYGHMVTIQRSENIWGPYESCPYNPILTHRNYNSEPIQCVGHGDLFDDQNGNWWMVVLGTRNTNVQLHHFGRETFLVPVEWKNGWPVVKSQKVSLKMEACLPGRVEERKLKFETSFCEDKIPAEFNFVRNPEDRYQWNAEKRSLIIDGNDTGLSENLKSPSFMGIRQKDFCGCVKCKIDTDLTSGEKAGVSVYYMHTHHYDLYLTVKDGEYSIELNKCIYDFEAVTKHMVIQKEDLKSGGLWLKIESDENYYTFYYSLDGENYIKVGKGMTAAMATEATEVTTFTGTYFGMFAQNGKATFKYFSYQWEESAKSKQFQSGMVYPDETPEPSL